MQTTLKLILLAGLVTTSCYAANHNGDDLNEKDLQKKHAEWVLADIKFYQSKSWWDLFNPTFLDFDTELLSRAAPFLCKELSLEEIKNLQIEVFELQCNKKDSAKIKNFLARPLIKEILEGGKHRGIARSERDLFKQKSTDYSNKKLFGFFDFLSKEIEVARRWKVLGPRFKVAKIISQVGAGCVATGLLMYLGKKLYERFWQEEKITEEENSPINAQVAQESVDLTSQL